MLEGRFEIKCVIFKGELRFCLLFKLGYLLNSHLQSSIWVTSSFRLLLEQVTYSNWGEFLLTLRYFNVFWKAFLWVKPLINLRGLANLGLKEFFKLREIAVFYLNYWKYVDPALPLRP